ncbi:MAG: hypothetical protein IKH33_00420 [Bacteroidales bacterium]|nr:hypothetical protein [Bacteroidales bacterium]MBR6990950.1 hypothetical protein [Bacteroidales bacterium]
MATPWEHDTHTIHAACRAATPVSTDSDVAVLQAAEAIITVFEWRCHTLYLSVPFRHSCHHEL